MAIPVGAVLGPIIGGFFSAAGQSSSGRAAMEAAGKNADDIIRISGKNVAEIKRVTGIQADSIEQVASLNAQNVLDVGFNNAKATLDVTRDNLQLGVLESAETLRRHSYQELRQLSNIRAVTGASGARVGQGSPLEIMLEAVLEGGKERDYIRTYSQKRLMNMGKDGMRRAMVTMKDASGRASLMLASASMQAAVVREEGASRATIMANDAELNAAQMRRSGVLMNKQASAAATGSIMNGIMGGITNYYKYK